jgi:hypothetical protein
MTTVTTVSVLTDLILGCIRFILFQSDFAQCECHRTEPSTRNSMKGLLGSVSYRTASQLRYIVRLVCSVFSAKE